MKEPLKAFHIFETQLEAVIKDLGSDQSNKAKRTNVTETDGSKYKISFEGSLGTHLVTPRGLTSRLINNYVGVQGIVTLTGRVRPRLLKSVHWCEATKKTTIKEYDDKDLITDEGKYQTSNAIPICDDNKNKLSMEYGLSEYKDVQTIQLQEMPERVPTGQLSRGIEIVLQDDLVDKVKPGDRVQINGVLRPISSSVSYSIGTFKTQLIATSVSVIGHSDENGVTPKELNQIKQIAERKDLFTLAAKSLAPSIYGHNYIKKAL